MYIKYLNTFRNYLNYFEIYLSFKRNNVAETLNELKKNALRRAVDHLIEVGRIQSDADISKELGTNRGQLSTFLNGKAEITKPFRNDFEKHYQIKIADFESEAVESIKNPGNEYQGKYIGVIEKLLDQDLKEIKSRLEAIELMLRKITDSFATAEARQRAAFVLTQWLTEEIASIPRNEKDRKKLVSEARKQIHERLEASLQENK